MIVICFMVTGDGDTDAVDKLDTFGDNDDIVAVDALDTFSDNDLSLDDQQLETSF